ncbi:HU domain-containing protein [Roseimarinus sediminis]|uniref:HU domain-containing protein n=1 Tax=Roseimarinus sediminis TaxID=1610899 RepID=UPI003D1D8726
MDITKHIAYLMQFHECVVVPDFGAFISNYQPAQYNREEHSFTPPGKAVIFNSKISRNDGLLVSYMVEKEQISYAQAQSAVMNFVDQLSLRLNNGEKVELGSLGSMVFDRSGAIIYQSVNQIDLAAAYGLQPFSYEALKPKHEIRPYQPRPAVRVVHRKRDLIKVAASIALVLSLSLFPLKNDLILQSSNLNPIQLLNSFQPKAGEVDETGQLAQTAPGQLEKIAPYILVGGSFQHLDNAKQLQGTLLNNGHQAEIIKMENSYYRVIIDSFFEKNEAIKAMNAYRSKHTGSKVWVSTR